MIENYLLVYVLPLIISLILAIVSFCIKQKKPDWIDMILLTLGCTFCYINILVCIFFATFIIATVKNKTGNPNSKIYRFLLNETKD